MIIYPNEPKMKDFIEESNIEDSNLWGSLGAHDPSIFKDNDTYYVFSTDARVGGVASPSIQIRKSKDLINWEYSGQVLNEIPMEAVMWTGAEGIWAPEVIKVYDEYYMYYCTSTFGKNKSCIGLLKSKSIIGPWSDEGIIIKTDISDDRNAIDPNLVYDKDGELWMSYGSFWTGIYIVKLDKNTGKICVNGDIGKQIAARSYKCEGAIEGAYIVYNKKFDLYYLFVSYDSLAYDYNIRVARSKSIEGPYYDINNVEMIDNNVINPNYVGNKIIGGYRFGQKGGWMAPGHNSVLNDNEEYYIVHHARQEFKDNYFYMHVRKILWNNEGWPMVCPERYAGESLQKVEESIVCGSWEVIPLYRDVNRVMVAKIYEFEKDGAINGEFNGGWKLFNDNNIKIKILIRNNVEEYEGIIIPAWDWEENKPTLTFTSIDQNGIVLWGKRKNRV